MPIELTGMNEMLTKFKKLESKFEKVKEREEILQAGAEPIRKAMSDRAPRGVKNMQTWQAKAGKEYAIEHLKDNIIISKMLLSSVDVGPSKVFFYAPMLEFGTVKMSSQAFAEPAFLEKKEEALQAMADKMRKMIVEGLL